MSKLKGQELVNRLTDVLGIAKGAPGDGSPARVLALNAINTAHGKVAQLGSMIWLQVWTTIVLNNNSDAAALPGVAPFVDISKRAYIGLPAGRPGTLTYLGPGRMLTRPMDTFGAWNTDRPSSWTWGADLNGVQQIRFDRQNTSGGGLTYPFRYQQIVPNTTIADDNVSVSLLPDGEWDETILLPLAELEEKRKLQYVAWESLYKILYGDDESNDNGRLAKFFDQFRLKDDPEPDSEQLRGTQVAQMSEGA